MLKTHRSEYDCCSQTEAEQCCGVPVARSLELGTSGSELSNTELGHMNGNSAIALGGASRRDTLVVADLHSPQLAGMNFLGMVSAGSGRSPRIKSSVLTRDAHAPLGINQIDISPADRDFLNGIDDNQMLITENKFGSNKNQVTGNDRCDRPSDCCGQTIAQRSRPDEASGQQNNATTHHQTTFGSKDILVAHSSIFSYSSRITDGQDK
jgi:hypothetical protein